MIDLKHAYLVMAHNNVKVLENCFKLIDDNRNTIFLFIDKKSKVINPELLKKNLKYSKLVIVPNFNIYWAGFSMIRANLSLLQTAFEYEEHFSYYHLISGADLPIKTQDEIHAYFDKYEGEEFVEINPSRSPMIQYKKNTFHLFVENNYFRSNSLVKFLNHAIATFQMKLKCFRNAGQTVYHGSALYSLSNQFVEYLLARKESILHEYKYTLASDEIFIQTEIMKSPFKEKLHRFEERMYGNARFIEWNNLVNKNSPTEFTMMDYERLLNADEHLLFARKFNENVDIEVVEKITKNLLNRQGL